MRNKIHTASGDGRWINHTSYLLREDGRVDVDTWLEDDDWYGYGNNEEGRKTRTIAIAECPAYIAAKLMLSKQTPLEMDLE